LYELILFENNPSTITDSFFLILSFNNFTYLEPYSSRLKNLYPTNNIDWDYILEQGYDKYKIQIAHSERKIWNLTHNIEINNNKVEIYIDENIEENRSEGKYSLTNDRWLKIPSKPKTKEEDFAKKKQLIELEFNKYRNKICTL
jgi:hypothetical protein